MTSTVTTATKGSGQEDGGTGKDVVNTLPPCRILVRSKYSVEMYSIPDDLNKSLSSSSPSSSSSSSNKVTLLDRNQPCTSNIPLCIAPDGSFVLIHTSTNGIVKCILNNNINSISDTEKDGGIGIGTKAIYNTKENFFGESTMNVQMMALSPLGNYVTTWEKISTTTTTITTTTTSNNNNSNKNNNNLKCYCTKTGQLVLSFVQKSISRESWPYIQFTYDERYMFVVVNQSQIRIYNMKDIIKNNARTADTTTIDPPRYCHHIVIPTSCTTLSVQYHSSMISTYYSEQQQSSTKQQPTKYYFTTFGSKTKDKPATVSIYSYSPTMSTGSSAADVSSNEKAFTLIATKSLYQAEECKTQWCPNVSTPACLLSLSVSVDVTGQSYYGNTQLYLWNANASSSTSLSATTTSTTDNTSLISVPVPQEGPVLACSWISDPNKPPSFIVIAGKIPPMISHHHGITGQTTFLYGNNVSRNTISITPHSRFVCFAGFGNMPGGMSFWDMNKKKLIPHCMANMDYTLKSDTPVTMYSWSPNSRYFLTATTAPRMNVENGLQLYKYTGERITNETMLLWNNKDFQPNLLYEATFVPSLLHIYPDRPQSPVPERRVENSTITVATSTSTTATTTQSTATTAPTSAAKKYVPPSARMAMGNGNSLAERLRREKEGTVQGAAKVVGGVVTSSSTTSTIGKKAVIPGLTVSSSTTTKSKSQMKREKLKQKQQQQVGTIAEPTENSNEDDSIDAATTTAMPSTANYGTTTNNNNNSINTKDPDAIEKRIRKLKKVLKQIDELKALPELNDDQKAKIASEGSILSELKELGIK